jgi:hypothetical protein
VSTRGRDGRILSATHWASLVIFLILVPAAFVLWLRPGSTADEWSWAIAPSLSAIFLGSGYAAGAYFFLRTFLASRWPPSSAGVFGAAFFAALMLIATLLHWDKFNHGDAPTVAAIAYYGWVGVYILSPFAVGALWFANRRTDSGVPEPGERLVPRGARLAARCFAVGAFGAAIVFFVFPDTAIDLWPWQLTPLTARVLGSFTAQVGAGALLLSADPRWSSWRLIVQTVWIAVALLLIGAVRYWGELDTGNGMTYLYVGGLAAQALALAALYRRMESDRGPSVVD